MHYFKFSSYIRNRRMGRKNQHLLLTSRLTGYYFKQRSTEISKMLLIISLQYTSRSFESVLIKFLINTIHVIV